MLATSADEPVARLPGLVITQRQFLAPLIEAHGLQVLIKVVQLELAKQNANRKGLTLTPQEFARERERTLEQAFAEADNKTQDQIDAAVARGDTATAERLRQELKRDRERALEQLLSQQRVSRPEFEMVVQTAAYLRKIAETEMRDISEDVLRKAFETEYGATVRVRHIQATSRQDLALAQERLKAGEPFERVARDLSRNPRTGAVGGELPKFSMSQPNMPQNFKETAFSLREGQVSDIVECDGAYHLIKLEQKFAPKAQKFEAVKDSLRAKVREQVLQGIVSQLQVQLADQARTTLKIEDPVMRDQFARKLEDRDRQIKEADKIQEQQERERRLARERQPGAPGAVGTGAAGTGAAPAVDPQKVLPVPAARPPAQSPGK